MRVSANGGTPESDRQEKLASVAIPQLLPDGKSVLFTDLAGVTPYQDYACNRSNRGNARNCLQGGIARYLPTGHIVYGLQNSNNLFAVPFDLKTLEVTGGPVPVVEGIALRHSPRNMLSPMPGTLVYMPGTTAGAARSGRTLVWVDRKGKRNRLQPRPMTISIPEYLPMEQGWL